MARYLSALFFRFEHSTSTGMDHQTKGKQSKIKKDTNLTDFEDSGVHLEDSSSGSRGWTENDLEYFIKQLTNPQLYTNKTTSTSSSWSTSSHHQQVTTHTTSTFHSADSLSTDVHEKCHIGSPSNLRSRIVAPYDSQLGSDGCLCHEKTKKSKSRTFIKTSKEHKTRSSNYEDSVEISVDSVLDEGFSSSNRPHSCQNVVYTTSTATSNITSCTGSGYCAHFVDSCSDDPDSSDSPQQQVSKRDKCADGCKKEHKRHFFHRMIPRPLRRSHSCGTAKDLATTVKSKTTEIELSDKVSQTKSSSIRKTSSFDARTLYLPDDLDGTSSSKPKSRNLAWNVKRKLHFLRRHHTDSSLPERFPKVNMVNAAKWGKSFDALIRDKDGLEIFRKYMRSEFSDENIDFWLAVEDYRASDESEFEKKANIIFKTFVAKSAARAVNLRAPNREKVRQRVETGVTRTTFDDSQKEIFDFMQRDTYQRFLKSEMYANACKS